MLSVLGAFFLLFGVFFFVMGVVGNLRLPDVFTRLHATSKITSLGILSLVTGSALMVPESGAKAALLGMLVLFSAPVASQAIARAAYRDGCRLDGIVQNDLEPVEYIDFDLNYTIGEDVPWANAGGTSHD
jgi:multicomponent Na+:H+ antiporter subunit G